jgi:hypothetical protein
MLRRPVFDKKIRETVKYVIGGDLPGRYDCQRLPAVLVDNGQNLECPSGVCSIRHKIIGPDIGAMRGPETDAGAVIKPQPTPFGLSLGDLEPLLTPEIRSTRLWLTCHPSLRSRAVIRRYP